MPFFFPANPSVGQTVTQNGRAYIWDGYTWRLDPNSNLPVASKTSSGVVQIGDNIFVDNSGIISVLPALVSVSWASIDGAPATFTPAPHANTHNPAGSDPLHIYGAQIIDVVPPSKLGSGSATANNVLHGDGTWRPATSLVVYQSQTSFPLVGLTGLIYLAADKNKVYYWNDSASVYQEIGLGASLATPSAPTGLTAIPDNAQVTLSWVAPANSGNSVIRDYSIQYSVNAGFTWATWTHAANTNLTQTLTNLTNGQDYLFRVAAVNSAGVGAFTSTTIAVTPSGLPSAPAGLTATAGNGQVTLTWLAPASNGAPITDYRVQYANTVNDVWLIWQQVASTSTSRTITGLTNGATYAFTVAAINVLGIGANAVPAISTPAGAPATPTNLSVAAGNGNVTLSWTAPANNGSAITDYSIQYSSNSGATWTNWAHTASNATYQIVNGLSNGTPYLLRVAAVNGVTTGAYVTSSVVTPLAAVPSQPTNLVATPANNQVALNWTTPANNGATITDYSIQYSNNGGATWLEWAHTASGLNAQTVTGLTNGTAYVFKVAAINSAGKGVYSTTASATPASLPAAIASVTATNSGNNFVLSWAAPVNNGAVITDYSIQYSSNSGATWTDWTHTPSTATTQTITGLTPNLAYIFRVAAVNRIGPGIYTVSNTITGVTAPDAPYGLTTTAGNAQVAVSWVAPANNGSAITDYLIQYSANGGVSWALFNDSVSTTTSATITGLTNGVTYYFRVAAVNSAGTSTYSSSVTAAPFSAAAAPTISTVFATANSAIVNWAAPASNGGSAITDYVVQYSLNSVNWTTYSDGTSTSTSATVTGLSAGTTYYFRVAAVNSAGTGTYSAAAIATTWAVPGAPTIPSTFGGDGQITISWTAPASNGGATITDYIIQYSADTVNWTTFNDSVSTTTSATITGLTNGVTYYFRVAAVNSAGTGPYSAIGSGQPLAAPNAPTGLTATPTSTQTVLSWIAPANNGSAITAYLIQYSSNGGASWTTITDSVPSITSTTVNGLTDGVTYYFKVAAVNAAGTGAYSATISSFFQASTVTVPSAPTNLIATSGAQQITLTWGLPANFGGATITDYVVQYGVDSINWTTFNDGISTSTNATITGLTNYTTYYFRVAAVNSAGTGTYSTIVNSQPAPVVVIPTQPLNLSASTTGTTVSLSWAPPASNGGGAITSYIVQYSLNASTWSAASATFPTATSATISGLTNGTTYYWRVAARNSAGTGNYSTYVSTTISANVPGQPTGLTATAGAGQVSLAWTAPANNGGATITDYSIQYSSNSGVTWLDWAEAVTTATNATITSLTPGTTYLFRVAAINSTGTGAYSASASATPISATPSAPQNVALIAGSRKFTVNWSTPANNGGSAITGYSVQYKTAAETTWRDWSGNVFNVHQISQTYFATEITLTIDGATTAPLNNGTTYSCRVAAINSAGVGNYVEQSVTPNANVPYTPATFNVANSFPGAVNLSWSAPSYDGGSAITNYRVQYSSDALYTDINESNMGPNNFTFGITGLPTGARYYFRIRAENQNGYGNWYTTSQYI